MLWFFLSISSALGVSIQDALSKKFFGQLSAREMAIATSLYSLPFIFATAPFLSIPKLDQTFWTLAIIVIPIDTLCFYLYMKAIRLSPLSLTIPVLAFTPVFMVLTGFLVLGEMPNGWGILGICLVVSGSYVLNVTELKNGYIAPFRALLKEPGSALMLVIAMFFSVTSVLGKKAVQHSSPLFFAFSFFFSVDVVVMIFFPFMGKTRWRTMLSMPRTGLCLGAVHYLQAISHSFAIIMVKAVYMISLKRSSILFSVLLGWLVFKEPGIPQRFLGALLMFLGIICITLLG